MAVFHQVFVCAFEVGLFCLVNILSVQGVDERMINVRSSSFSSSSYSSSSSSSSSYSWC